MCNAAIKSLILPKYKLKCNAVFHHMGGKDYVRLTTFNV